VHSIALGLRSIAITGTILPQSGTNKKEEHKQKYLKKKNKNRIKIKQNNSKQI
jgi:hypothetical protein